jgi:1-acyl-sn-glycerol-3-phosphate acyltransferase
VRLTGRGLERGSVRRINSIMYRIIKGAARIYLAPFFEIRVQGRENVPRRGSFLLLPKHQRWEDIPLLGLASPVPLYYVAKMELFMNRFSRWFLSSLGGIPLDRRRPLASRDSIKAVIELLRDEAGVVIFPEGTYYENKMGSGHLGLIRLVRSRLDVPLIPTGIRYSGKGRRKLVEINFGRALHWVSCTKPEEFLSLAMMQISVLSGL